MGAIQQILAATGFNPASLGTLAAWWDANSIGTLYTTSALSTNVAADADPVGGWTDKSGNGVTLSQATAGKRPLYKTSIQNGLPAILFDGTNDVMTSGAIDAQPVTIAIVAKMTTVSTYFYDGADGSNRCALGDGVGGVANKAGYFAGTTVIEANYTVAGSPFNLWLTEFNGASSSLRKNAAAFASGNPGTQGLANGITLGNRLGLSFYLNGYVAELLIYKTAALPTASRDALEAYLRTKWNV